MKKWALGAPRSSGAVCFGRLGGVLCSGRTALGKSRLLWVVRSCALTLRMFFIPFYCQFWLSTFCHQSKNPSCNETPKNCLLWKNGRSALGARRPALGARRSALEWGSLLWTLEWRKLIFRRIKFSYFVLSIPAGANQHINFKIILVFVLKSAKFVNKLFKCGAFGVFELETYNICLIFCYSRNFINKIYCLQSWQ